MTPTDYRQIHETVQRAVSEMRGIAARLYMRDGAAAELVSGAADELMAMIGKLQPFRVERDRDRDMSRDGMNQKEMNR